MNPIQSRHRHLMTLLLLLLLYSLTLPQCGWYRCREASEVSFLST